MEVADISLRSSGLEPGLFNLIKTMASQLNGCAYCLDMHTKDARALGETEQRLYASSAWRATPVLHRSGTSCARLDRGGDAHQP